MTNFNKGNTMTEYDNTNSGAVFKPFDNMKMILSGRINIEGNDRDVIFVTDKTKSGSRIIKVYQKMGILFENDTTNSNAPNYSGVIDEYATNKDMTIAAWKKEKDDGTYMSIKISQKYNPNSIPDVSIKDSLEDDIPF